MTKLPPLTRREMLRWMGTSVLFAAAAPLLPSTKAWAFGESGRLHLGVMQYPGEGSTLRKGAPDALLLEVEQTTSIQVARRSDMVDAQTGDLSLFPLLFVTGDRAFAPWNEHIRARLRVYLQAGGMLVFDSSEGRIDGAFRESVAREMAAILPEKTFARTSANHVLYKSFYLCLGNEGRLSTAEYTESMEDEGRIQVLYVHNDLLGAYARNAAGGEQLTVSGGTRRRDYAFRFGVNLVMYALCLDYKEDQVHVPFILRRRRWSVP